MTALAGEGTSSIVAEGEGDRTVRTKRHGNRDETSPKSQSHCTNTNGRRPLAITMKTDGNMPENSSTISVFVFYYGNW